MIHAPRCPECGWHLSFRERGASWVGSCWNDACTEGEVTAGGFRDPVTRLSEIREKARGWGWSLALHGSNIRDLDFVATPWATNAISHPSFVRMLSLLFGAEIVTTQWKPHGRIGYLLTPKIQPSPGGFRSVDVSVLDARDAYKKAAA